jgi:hypothetical protein
LRQHFWGILIQHLQVPLSVLYDNDRCLVSKILPDGTRLRATLFSGFLSHYLFRDRYGRPGKGNDKGKVEGLVGLSRRNFMVPIPRFATWDAFNAHLEEQCRRRQADVLRGRSETIGERLARDLAAMSEPPAASFDACDQSTGRVSSQALVRYKTNDYSVPVAYGHRDVWIRGYVDAVVIGCGGEIIARHQRCYDREDMVFDPIHYLPLIEQKINVSAGIAELVAQRAKAYGAVPKAHCTNSISSILRGVPGFENLPQTYYPNKLSDAFGQLPGVTSRKITDDDADDNHGVLLVQVGDPRLN